MKKVVKLIICIGIQIFFVLGGIVSVICIYTQKNEIAETAEMKENISDKLDAFYARLETQESTLKKMEGDLNGFVGNDDAGGHMTLILSKDNSQQLKQSILQTVNHKLMQELNSVNNSPVAVQQLQEELKRMISLSLEQNASEDKYQLTESEKNFIISSTVTIVETEILKEIQDNENYAEAQKALEESLTDLKKQLKALKKIPGMESQIEDLYSQIQEYMLESGEANNEILNQINNLQTSLDDAKKALSSGTEADLSALQKSLEAVIASMDEMHSSKLLVIKDELQKLIDTKANEKEISEIVSNLQTVLDNSISEINSEIKNNYATITELNTTKNDWENANDILTAAQEALESKNEANITAAKKELQALVNSLEINSGLKDKEILKSLEEAIGTLEQADALSAAEASEALKNAQNTINSKIKAIDNEMSSLNNSITDITSDISTINNTLADLKTGMVSYSWSGDGTEVTIVTPQ